MLTEEKTTTGRDEAQIVKMSKGYKPSFVLMIRVAEEGEKVKQSTFAAPK